MKRKLNLAMLFLTYLVVFFLLSRACIMTDIMPFAFPMLFALAWANQKVWLLAPAFLAGVVINFHSFEGVISALVAVLFLVVPYYIHLLVKKPMKKWELFTFAGLSQTGSLIFWILSGTSPVVIACNILLGLAFLFACLGIFEPLLLRGFTYKITTLEIVCAGVVTMAFAAGLSLCDIYGFSVLKLFVCLALLAVNFSSRPAVTMIFAALMGIGSMLPDNNPVMIAPFIIWALAAIVFRSYHKVFSAVAVIASEFLIGYYFCLYYGFGVIDFMPVVVSGVVFALLPRWTLDNLSSLLSGNNDRLAVKNVVNRNREILQRRLGNLSEVFCDMNNVFRKLIKSEMSPDQVADMLYEEVKSTICKGCSEQNHCHRTFGEDTKKLFKELIAIAFERGRVTLLDLPSYLSSRCGKANHLLSEINTLTAQYKSYSRLVGNVDTSKLLISDQLAGISGIMKTLASEVDTMASFDDSREGRIIDELAQNNIICTDAVVYESGSRTTMATLVVRDEDQAKLKLPQTVSKICGGKMVISDSYPAGKAGLVSVNLKSAPMSDCLFGLACQTRSGSNISGDSHSIERLDCDKFMFAICDGMGSGEAASEKSQTAIGLVENFYKAGFDNEIILSSVNKLLNLERDDMFSTMDICIVDLKSGIADFIKMGAASSYVRSTDECKIIECQSLPVGVLQDVKTQTKKIVLQEKDMIVICSDGISDTFSSDADMKDFLLTIKAANPQEFADAILSQALANNNGYAVDDMTCLVVKII